MKKLSHKRQRNAFLIEECVNDYSIFMFPLFQIYSKILNPVKIRGENGEPVTEETI